MRFIPLILVVLAVAFLTHKWLSSMPEAVQALAGGALVLAIAFVGAVFQ
jgi:hypothetical protein